MILVSACGGGPIATTPPTAGTSGAGLPTPGDTAAAEIGPVPGDPDAIDPSAEGQAKLIAQAVADRAANRDRAGMVDYLGTDSTSLAAAMDRQSSELLARMLSAAEARAPIELVSARLPLDAGGSTGGPRDVPAPGQLSAGTWVGAVALLDVSFGKGSPSNNTNHSTEEVAIGQNKGSVRTDTTVTVTPSGSRISINIEASTSGSVSHASGKLLFRINGKSHAHIDAQGCPDAGGLAPAHVDTTDQEDYFIGGEGGSVGHGWTNSDSGDIRIFVNDQAEIERFEMDMQGADAVKGGKRASGASDSDLDAWSVAVAGSATTGPTFTTVISADRRVTAKSGATRQNATDTWRGLFTVVALVAITAGQAAREFWQSGNCVEVVPTPTRADVDPDSTTTLTAKVRHKFEGNELDKAVEATISGVKSIEPASQRVPSPASFTYTAGPDEGDSGDVALTSVSNRGIGKTTVTFTVNAKKLKVAISGKMTTSGFGVSYTTSLDFSDIVLSRQTDGTYAGSGPATASVLIGIADCPKPYTQKGTFKLGATRPVVENQADRTWIVTFDPSTTFSFEGGSCVGAPIELFVGSGDAGPIAGFMFVLGPVEIPQDGGAVHVARTTSLGQSKNVIDATVTGKIVSGLAP